MKELIVCFSGSGTTLEAANKLRRLTGADFYKIEPKEPYSNDDLNWMDTKSRSSVEMKDPTTRPEIANKPENLDNYDKIYLGFPVWWYTCPHIVNNFIESYDFSNKTVYVFFTSGSTKEDVIEKSLNDLYPGLAKKVKRFNNISDDEIIEWVK